MNDTIKTCKCQHEFQDKEYGKNQRVHNQTQKGDLRCTVCGNEKKSK